MNKILIGILVAALLVTCGTYFYHKVFVDEPNSETTDVVVLIDGNNGQIIGTSTYAPDNNNNNTQTPIDNTTQTPNILPSDDTTIPIADMPTNIPAGNMPTNNQSAAVPSTPAEVLAAFNTASAKAATANGSKTVIKTLQDYSIEGDSVKTLKERAGDTFDSIAKSCIEGTLACGSTNASGTGMLVGAAISEADVLSATATGDALNYNVTITLKDSINPGSGTTPIEKVTKDFLTLADLQANGPANNLTVGGVDATITATTINANVVSNEIKSVKITYTYKGTLTDCVYKLAILKFDGISGSGSLTVEININY